MSPSVTCPKCKTPVTVPTPNEPVICGQCGVLIPASATVLVQPEPGQVQAGLPEGHSAVSRRVRPGMRRQRVVADATEADLNVRVSTFSTQRKGRAAVITLAICLVAILVEFGTAVYLFSVLMRLQDARQGANVIVVNGVVNPINAGELRGRVLSATAMHLFALVLYLLTILVATICFLMWVYNAYRNLQDLRVAGLQASPGWAVAWFFLPVFNLIRPYQIVQEIWKASDPDHTLTSSDWRDAPASGTVAWWWLASIAVFAVGRCGYFVASSPQATLQTAISATVLGMVASAIELFAGFLLINIIRGIDARQEQRYLAVHNRREYADW